MDNYPRLIRYIIKKKNIIGILKLSSRVKYGYSDRKIPYYKFKPYKKDLPNFLVCSKSKIKKDVFTIISFNKWKDNTSYPRGNIELIIGEVGDINNEYKYVLYQNNLFYKSWKSIINKNKLLNKIENDIKLDNQLQKLNTEYNVISIDPKGCTDIDDALHITLNKNIVEIGIHITNVNYYLNNSINSPINSINSPINSINSPINSINSSINSINKFINERLFSVYSPINQQNMIPYIYANNLCSLIENKNRKVISVIYKYNLLNNEIINESFIIKESIVKNIKNFTYNEVDNIIDNILNNNIKFINKKIKKFNQENNIINNLYKFINILNKNIKTKINNKDSHKIVEYFMIKANTTIGNYLFDNIKDKTIVRSHSQSESINCLNIPNNINNYVNLRLMKKAQYNFANLNPKNNFHYGLKLYNYTHFTSPIRRYNDILIHQLILSLINNTKNIKINNEINIEIINKMNKKQKKINKAERMFRRLTVINELEKQYINEPIKTIAYIVDIQDESYSIYIPKYNLEEKIYDTTTNIIYDKINIQIIPFLKEQYYWNKIKINIL